MKTSKTAILLEDDPDISLYVLDILKVYDLHVKHFTNPIDSIALLSTAALIILDYHLPGMNGLEYLAFLKKNFPNIPVIMITGQGSENVCLHAFRLGVKDYLKKPFAPAEMREIVNKFISTRSSGPRGDENEKAGGLDSETLKRLYLAKNHIDSNIEGKLELNDVLKIACMSRPTFAKYFKQIFHATFKNYVLDKKIEQAKHLLRQGSLSISEIAYSLGFTDPSHFSRVFKKSEGVPPSKMLR
jgi:YesN/AraC family two-component response regulator